MMIATSNYKCGLTRGIQIQSSSSMPPTLLFPFSTTIRMRSDSVNVCKSKLSVVNSKKANLSAAKKERIPLPVTDEGYRFSEFLSHPFGIRAMLNTNALQNFESLDTNTYRCFLRKLQLLNFEAAPVLELRVTPTEEDCVVEMLSCKFRGSEILERQNKYFTAFMMNRVTWNTIDSEPFLEADMKLNVTLEIYTAPFTLLPESAVEGPGNLMVQALVDRLISLFLQQLLQDYDEWTKQQFENLP
ncbi:uncharacterized protein [Euphorbia lathyris]|uniref:uncharacterized protein isoform X2 n=1 Tax=Euphorbia lathyris TaxID=212925 RepID=UPI0033141A97